ncbi:MAG: hypothetical protein QF464_14930, partial [Myxococcota bacterium]|nr:hypothetical protein [Myxococcota bacterium]
TLCEGDGDGCTVDDSCMNGTCIVGAPAECSEIPSQCKYQVCTSIGTNQYLCVPENLDASVACDDGLFCTTNDHCDGTGTCTSTDIVDCGETIPCHNLECIEAAEGCTTQQHPDGQLCNADSNGCTQDDYCDQGFCVPGAPPECSGDGNTCLVEGVCESTDDNQSTCHYAAAPEGTACESEDYCIVDTVCDGQGACGGGVPRDCLAEADACQTAECDSSDETCKFSVAPDGSSCDDGNPCTVIDYCWVGSCDGNGNACQEELLSVAVGGSSRPSVTNLGYGRYVVEWAGDPSYNASGYVYDYIRMSDPYGSREDEELNVRGDVPPFHPSQFWTQFTTPTGVTSSWDFLTLSWTATGCGCDQIFEDCVCLGGNLVARSYDYQGTPLHTNLAVEERTLELYASVSPGYVTGSSEVIANDTDTLAFSDGSWGLFKIDTIETTGPNPVVSPPLARIVYTPLSSELVAGDSKELLDAYGVQFAANGDLVMSVHHQFDVVGLPGTTDFLLFWITTHWKSGGPKHDQLMLQRYTHLGGEVGNRILVFENKLANSYKVERMEARYVADTGEILVAW